MAARKTKAKTRKKKKAFDGDAADNLHHTLEVFEETLSELAPPWLQDFLKDDMDYMRAMINVARDEPKGQSDKARLQRYAFMHNKKKELEARKSTVNSQMEKLEPRIMDYFISIGSKKITIEGNTLSTKRELWFKVPEGMTKAKISARLKKDKLLSKLVEEGFNSNALSAVIREWDDARKNKDKDPIIPKKWQKYIGVSEIVKIAVRKS